MKKTILSVLLLVFAGSNVAFAQKRDNQKNDERRKERIEQQAKDQAKALKLDDETSTWFQNLYVEYQEQLDEVRRAAMADVPRPDKKNGNAEASDEEVQLKDKEMKKLTDEQAEKIIQANFDRTEKELAVKKTYYQRFREKLSPKQLIRIFSQQRRGGQQNRNRQGGFPGGGMGPMGGPGGFGGPGF